MRKVLEGWGRSRARGRRRPRVTIPGPGSFCCHCGPHTHEAGSCIQACKHSCLSKLEGQLPQTFQISRTVACGGRSPGEAWLTESLRNVVLSLLALVSRVAGVRMQAECREASPAQSKARDVCQPLNKVAKELVGAVVRGSGQASGLVSST